MHFFKGSNRHERVSNYKFITTRSKTVTTTTTSSQQQQSYMHIIRLTVFIRASLSVQRNRANFFATCRKASNSNDSDKNSLFLHRLDVRKSVFPESHDWVTEHINGNTH